MRHGRYFNSSTFKTRWFLLGKTVPLGGKLCTYQCLAPPTPGRAMVGLGGVFDAKNAPGVGELVTTKKRQTCKSAVVINLPTQMEGISTGLE